MYLHAALSGGWYDAGTRIVVPAQIVHSGGTRYVIYAESNCTVTSPSTISPPYYTQYYVEVNEEVPAEIDGVNVTLASGWYNASTTIVVFNFYYFNDTVRLAIRSNVSQVTLSGPTVIDIFAANYQYYVTVALPNGTLSGWYSAGSTITLPTTIYNGSLERYVINQSGELVVDRPINMTALYVRQFYVLIEMPNGTIEGWYDAGSSIKLPSVIYNGTAERYVINQSDTLTVSSPISEAPSYVKQFLVTVNGASSWYNAGSTIRLYEPVPWYETLTWVGSYTLPNGANVTVYGPIVESARTSINVEVVGGLAGAVVVAAAVGVVAIRRR